MLKFIHERMEKELQDFVKFHRIRLVDQSLNSLTFSCDLMDSTSASNETAVVIEPGWEARVEKAFNEKSTSAIKVYEDSRLRTFKFVSRKSNSSILNSLKVNIESVEPLEEYVTGILDGFDSVKLRAFEVLGFKYDVESKTRVQLTIHMNDEQINREIEREKLRGIWGIHSDGGTKELFICCEDSEKYTFQRFHNLIFRCVDTNNIAIDGEMDPEAMDVLRSKIRDMEDSMEPFEQVKLRSKCIRITCRKDLMLECRQQLQDFVNLHIICTCEVYIMSEIADYMHDKMKSQIELYLLKACGKAPDWHFKHSKFYITGNRSVRSKCTEVLYVIASKVIVTWRSVERRGIQDFFTSDAGKNTISRITGCHLKILRQESQTQNICAVVVNEEGQAICIGVMDQYKQSVDGILNVLNEDIEDFRKSANEVEREIADYIQTKGKLTEGEVFVTGSGKLPCFKILHAVAPNWRDGTENEFKKLKRTIEKIFSVAEANSIRSIAMPMVACRTKFGYPMKRAATILLQTITGLCLSRFKSIREIYICDKDSKKIKIVKRLAEELFGAQCFFISRRQILKFDETSVIIPQPNVKLQQRQQTTKQRKGTRIIPLPTGRKVIFAWGDLARLSNCTPPLKADIIVNPCTTFPVLTGNIANSLKAASSYGGTFELEGECRKNEPLGGLQNGSFVVTNTPHMSCDQILHLRIEHNWSNINEKVLYSYINSCMNYALASSVRSIAFPTIGTGTKGYPRDIVARCFMHAITEFSHISTNESLKELIIVIYHRDSETTTAFEKELQSLLPKRPHRLVACIKEEILEDSYQWRMKHTCLDSESGSSSLANPSRSSLIPMGTYLLRNGGSLTLKHGRLEDSGAAVLVSTTSAIPNLQGHISSAIKIAAGGTTIQDELQRNYGKGINVGDIAITGAGNIIGANKVYHLKLEDYNPQKRSQVKSD
ncbi:hypothetical protein CHS0354_037270 [Potamilus streckersoni]|uniref:Macro domain-containing protein n=1 Tax=Potamilus streckersoni TaxID=2493646 RepID=A0AAE0SXA9_9BIVA|nr:hypothetical protein CHS0354_037270 [Potamilus streckersoni]